ncbi:MAG: hypothetical protein ACM3JE_04820 [Betaproteobacteria bacterium]
MAEEKKEIIVKAPSKPVTSPEEKTRKTTEKALEEERFGVLQFPKKISKYLGITVAANGVMLLVLFAYMSATGQTGGLLLSSEMTSGSLFIWGLVGVINIIVGFLFMGRE